MSEEVKIIVNEKYGEALDANLIRSCQKENNCKPQGHVEIYEEDENGNVKLVSKSNLVVYLGREWLVSRAMNIDNTSILPLSSDWLCWFGVGYGGCPVGNPFDPISPTNNDISLNSEFPFITEDEDLHYGDFRAGSGCYKKLFDSDPIFVQDENNDNAYLIAQITITLTAQDCNGYIVNEAALFTAPSNGGGLNTGFNMYAKVTFPSMPKIESRNIIFVWNIYY